MGERAERCEWYIQYHPPSLLIPSKLLDIDTLGVDPNDLEEEEFTAYAEEYGLHLDMRRDDVERSPDNIFETVLAMKSLGQTLADEFA